MISTWKRTCLVTLAFLMVVTTFLPQIVHAREYERAVVDYETATGRSFTDRNAAGAETSADMLALAAGLANPVMGEALSVQAAPPRSPLSSLGSGTVVRLARALDPYLQDAAEPGLLLVTRQNTCDDDVADHSEMVQCVDHDAVVDPGWFGASIVSEINQAENIHGHDDDYTSYYTGFFYMPEHDFLSWRTDSDGSSEIVIDGQVVASSYGGPGSSEAPQQLIYKGWHHIAYRHQEIDGGQLARARFATRPGSWKAVSTDNLDLRALPFEPGLLLTTKRATCEDQAADHDEMVMCVEQTSLQDVDWYGASVVDRIDQTQNIHGEDDGYVSRYEGYFLVEAGSAGAWEFRTYSDDGSEVEIDGQLVASQYGPGTSSGSLSLGAGWHHVVCRHQEVEGNQREHVEFKAPGDLTWRTLGTAELDVMTHAADRDWDGLPDSVEGVLGTDPESSDTDLDQVSDFYEAVYSMDPLSPDSNGDGLNDYVEIAYEGVLDAERNNDSWGGGGDTTANVWDRDNDSDGVPDGLDPSPFVRTKANYRYHFEVQTTGNPTYLDLQLRPENPGHLNYSNGAWDWPDDYDAQMQDIDRSREDLRIVPLLEVNASEYPMQAEVDDYHISVADSFKSTDWTDAIRVGGTGGHTDGGGSALADINGNGKPELFLVSVDDPSGANEFRYRVGWDVGSSGRTGSWSDTIRVEGLGGGTGLGDDNAGAGAAIGYINDNLRPDLVLMAIYNNPSGGNAFLVAVGWDLDAATGEPDRWGPLRAVGGLGHNNAGGGVALADINGNGSQDLVLMGVDDPGGADTFWYKIGWDLGSSVGWTDDWSDVVGLGGLGHRDAGGGATIADVNLNGTPDLVLMGVDDLSGADSFRYRVGWDLDHSGQPESWSVRAIEDGLAKSTDGGGAAVADLNGNGAPDLLLMGVDDCTGPNDFLYRVGWDLEPKLMVPLSPVQDQGTTVAMTGRVFLPASEPGTITLDASLVWVVQAVTERYGQAPWGPVLESEPLYQYDAGFPPFSEDTETKLNGQAGGAAMGDLDGDADGFDLLVSGICTVGPDGSSPIEQDLNFCYRIGWDMNDQGEAVSWSDLQLRDDDLVRGYPSTWSNFYGGGAAIADVDGSGSADLVLMGIDYQGHDFGTGLDNVSSFWYVVGHDVQSDGSVDHWGALHRSPDEGLPMVAGRAHGAGLAIDDVDEDGALDVVLMTRVNDDGDWKLRYWVGWDIDDDGTPANGWTATIEAPSSVSFPEGEGAGADLADLNGNDALDLVLTLIKSDWEDDELLYMVAWDLDEEGLPTHWTQPRPVAHDLGKGREEMTDHQGGGAAVGDLDGNGLPDVLGAAVHMHNNKADAAVKYTVGWDLGASEETSLARYYERFVLTSFKAAENHGSQLGVFYSDEADEDGIRDEAASAIAALRYEFLNSENPLASAPDSLTANGVDVSSDFAEHDHHDAALIGSAEMINDALDTLPDGSDLPIVIAVEDVSSSLWMDSLGDPRNVVIYENDFVLDLAAEPQVVLKSLRMPWYDTDSNEPLDLGEIMDVVQNQGETGSWSDLETEQVAMLIAAWDFGESRMTRVGVVSTVYYPPEANIVLNSLQRGLSTARTIAKLPGLVNGLRVAGMAWSKGLGLKSAAKAGLAYRNIVGNMNAAPGGIDRVEQALGRPLNSGDFGKLSSWSRAAKWLKVAGVVMTIGITAFSVYQMGEHYGWSAYGTNLAIGYAVLNVFYTVMIQVAFSLGVLGLIVGLLIILSDLLVWAITGTSWTERIISDILVPEQHIHCEPDLDLRHADLAVVDEDDNGLDVGDSVRYDLLARQTIRCAEDSDYLYDCRGSYIYPDAEFKVPPGIVAGSESDSTEVSYTCDECTASVDCDGKGTVEDHEIAAWVEFDQPILNLNPRLEFSARYHYRYSEDGTNPKTANGTTTNSMSSLFVDVLPGSVGGLAGWDVLEDLDPDRDGLLMHGPDHELAADGTLLDTDPNDGDTDGDGLTDGYEVHVGRDPLVADADLDGLDDKAEMRLGTDPDDPDTDGDGLTDREEVDGWSISIDYRGTTLSLEVSSNPLLADTDGDTLTDDEDRASGLNPASIDTDGDGIWDPFDTLPEAAAGGPYTVDEGGTATLDGSASTGSNGPLTYAWDFDEDGEFDDATGATPTFSAAGLDGPSEVTVTLQACDEAYPSNCDTDTAGITVENVAPTVTLSGTDSADEGETRSYTFSTADAGGDDLTVSNESCGASAVLANPSFDAATGDGGFDCTFLDGPLVAAIEVVVTDDDGDSGSDILDVQVSNIAPVVEADVAAQSCQHSDSVCDVTFTATDVAADAMSAQYSGLWESLTPAGPSCADSGDGIWRTCEWQVAGTMDEPVGSYITTIAISDDDGGVGGADAAIDVTHEDAGIWLSDDNPASVQVDSPGGDSPAFSLVAHVGESDPDVATCEADSGDIGDATVEMSLDAIGPGASYSVMCAADGVAGTGYDAVLTVKCDFDGVAVNTYRVQAAVVGDYYASDSAESVLVVSDPSLGFSTGGGWFYWPGTTDKTNFGYSVMYKKKGGDLKGNLLVIRHLDDGSGEIHRLKSSELGSLSLGESSEPSFGWATLNGKGTYKDRAWEDPIDNYEFLVFVEDHGTPGSGHDRFWLEVLDAEGSVVTAMSLARPAGDHPVTLGGGNIKVSHDSN